MTQNEMKNKIAEIRARRAERGQHDPLNRLTAHINRAITNGAAVIEEIPIEKTAFLHGYCIRKDGTLDSMWTQKVPMMEKPLHHHVAGLQYTASGYGAAIPSRYMVNFKGRWRRVYIAIYGNSGTAYIKTGTDERITVQEI